MNQNKIFIVGAARSGTNLLSRILSSSPEVIDLRELRYYWTSSNLLWDCSEHVPVSNFTNRSIRLFNNFYARQSSKFPSAKTFIDKTPSNAFRLDLIDHLFPGSLIIHIIRDPRDNILSRRIQSFGGHRAFGKSDSFNRYFYLSNLFNGFRKLMLNDAIPASRLPYAVYHSGLSRLPQFITGCHRRWSENVPGYYYYLKHFGPIAAYSYQIQEAVSTARMLSENLVNSKYVEVRFEDILCKPKNALCSISGLDQYVNVDDACSFAESYVKRSNTNKWKSIFTDQDLSQIYHICSSLFFSSYSSH
jgi:hypothetical protein